MVQINIAPRFGKVLISPSNLTFTRSNWSSSKIVNVSVVNDFVDQGDFHFEKLEFNVTMGNRLRICAQCVDYNRLAVAPFNITIRREQAPVATGAAHLTDAQA